MIVLYNTPCHVILNTLLIQDILVMLAVLCTPPLLYFVYVCTPVLLYSFCTACNPTLQHSCTSCTPAVLYLLHSFIPPLLHSCTPSLLHLPPFAPYCGGSTQEGPSPHIYALGWWEVVGGCGRWWEGVEQLYSRNIVAWKSRLVQA